MTTTATTTATTTLDAARLAVLCSKGEDPGSALFAEPPAVQVAWDYDQGASLAEGLVWLATVASRLSFFGEPSTIEGDRLLQGIVAAQEWADPRGTVGEDRRLDLLEGLLLGAGFSWRGASGPKCQDSFRLIAAAGQDRRTFLELLLRQEGLL